MKILTSALVLGLCLIAGPAFAKDARKVASGAKALNCAGSEPFWSAAVKLDDKGGASLKFSPAEGKAQNFPKVSVEQTNNDGNVRFFRTAKKDLFAALIDSGARGTPCLSEGEAPENEHPFELMMMIGGTPFVGCCK